MLTDINLPGIEPVTLDAAKLFLRIDHDDEDALITELIQSARERLESLCRTTLIMRAQRLTLLPPFHRKLALSIHPIQSVTGVTLHLQEGGEESVDIKTLCINLRSTPATIEPTKFGLWGWHNRQDVSALTVDVVAGYGEAINDIPMPLRQAMMLLVGQGYENRSGREVPSVPTLVDALIMPYRSLKI